LKRDRRFSFIAALSSPSRAAERAFVEEEEKNEKKDEGNRGDHGASLPEPFAATAGSVYVTSVPSLFTAS
jgi:hypothetical protein